jgi:hypothetical protein
VHGKVVRQPIVFAVLMFCLQLCFSDAASSIEETSSYSSSVIAQPRTDVAQNDVPTMEGVSSGDGFLDGVTSAANGAAVVAFSNAAVASRSVFADGVKRSDTTPMTTNVVVDMDSAADSLLQQLQEALRLYPNVHSKPVEKIFLEAMVLYHNRTVLSHQIQSKLIDVEGSKSTTTSSSSSSSGELLWHQLTQLQKEVLQVMARGKASKEETLVKVRVVMKKVIEVLNKYFVQNPTSNELTSMPDALGMKLKRKGRGVVVVSGGRRRRLAACPTINTADHDSLKDTDGWNVWSASCAMSDHYTVSGDDGGKTVKIKKSPSMSGELVIDRGATSGSTNQHFRVYGALELEDITLTGGHGVSSFVSSCIVVKYSLFYYMWQCLCN